MIELTDAKAHLRVLDDAEDAYISNLISSAILHVENETGRKFLQQTIVRSFEGFADVLPLSVTPVMSVDNVSYVNVNGDTQQLTGYYISRGDFRTCILPAFGGSFPAVKAGYESVTVTYTAGASQWPRPISQAVLLLVGHWFANREAVVVGAAVSDLPLAYASLIQPYKVSY